MTEIILPDSELLNHGPITDAIVQVFISNGARHPTIPESSPKKIASKSATSAIVVDKIAQPVPVALPPPPPPPPSTMTTNEKAQQIIDEDLDAIVESLVDGGVSKPAPVPTAPITPQPPATTAKATPQLNVVVTPQVQTVPPKVEPPVLELRRPDPPSTDAKKASSECEDIDDSEADSDSSSSSSSSIDASKPLNAADYPVANDKKPAAAVPATTTTPTTPTDSGKLLKLKQYYLTFAKQFSNLQHRQEYVDTINTTGGSESDFKTVLAWFRKNSKKTKKKEVHRRNRETKRDELLKQRELIDGVPQKIVDIQESILVDITLDDEGDAIEKASDASTSKASTATSSKRKRDATTLADYIDEDVQVEDDDGKSITDDDGDDDDDSEIDEEMRDFIAPDGHVEYSSTSSTKKTSLSSRRLHRTMDNELDKEAESSSVLAALEAKAKAEEQKNLAVSGAPPAVEEHDDDEGIDVKNIIGSMPPPPAIEPGKRRRLMTKRLIDEQSANASSTAATTSEVVVISPPSSPKPLANKKRPRNSTPSAPIVIEPTSTQVEETSPISATQHVFGIGHVETMAEYLRKVAEYNLKKTGQKVVEKDVDRLARGILCTTQQRYVSAHQAYTVSVLCAAALVDESLQLTSKSNVADKPAVRQMSAYIGEADELANTLRQHEAQSVKRFEKALSKAGGAISKPFQMRRLVPFAALCANRALLTSIVVREKNEVHIAMALRCASLFGNSYERAINDLCEMGLLQAPVADMKMTSISRTRATRFAVIDDLVHQTSSKGGGGSSSNAATKKPTVATLAKTPIDIAVVTQPKTVAKATTTTAAAPVDAQQNNDSVPPPPPPPTTTTSVKKTQSAFNEQALVKLLGGVEQQLMIGSSESQFKWNIKSILAIYDNRMVLVPNNDLVVLLQIMFDELNDREAICDHFTAASSFMLRKRDSKLEKAASTPAIASLFSCSDDTKTIERDEAFYAANPDVPRSGHERIIQHQRDVIRNIVADTWSFTERSKLDEFNETWPMVAHVLFGFLRCDTRITARSGDIAYHPTARVVRENDLLSERGGGNKVELHCNELPLGVSISVPPMAQQLVTKLWNGYMHSVLKIATKPDGVLPDNVNLIYNEARARAFFPADQRWFVDYLRPGSPAPTAEQRIKFRDIMMPIMYALFPPTRFGRPPARL